MLSKFAVKLILRSFILVVMFLLGTAAFNLYYFQEKLQMLKVVNEFHDAQVNNDKKVINDLLTDDFTESGRKISVETPDFIYKRDILHFNFPKDGFKLEAKYTFPSSVFGNSYNTFSFVRVITLLPENGGKPFSVIFYVTYTFEKTAGGLKISKIERNL